MRWEPAEEADFVKSHLGPAFAADGITARIVVWDHNWDEPGYPIAVLDDPSAKAWVAGHASTPFKLRWAGQSILYTLPAQSAATFKW